MVFGVERVIFGSGGRGVIVIVRVFYFLVDDIIFKNIWVVLVLYRRLNILIYK